MLRWVLVVFACINVGLPIANARAESSATDSVMQYLTTYGVFHNGNYYQESNFGYGHVGWTEFRGKLKNSISYDDTKPGPDPPSGPNPHVPQHRRGSLLGLRPRLQLLDAEMAAVELL